MKQKFQKINYPKWIPFRFSSFQAKLLAAFLVATLLPLICIALVSYNVSYNLARDWITNSVLMSDEQLLFQLNSRLNQTENVADTIQFQMYSFEHTPNNQIDSLKTFNTMRSNISLYKSTFDFYHIYIFLCPEQTGADESLYFFSTDMLTNYGITESDLDFMGSSSLWLVKKNTFLPKVVSSPKTKADTILCFRALKNKSSGVLEYAYCIALDTEEFSRYLQAASSDSAISSYILTPQGQIAAHSDSSLNETWISDSVKDMLFTNANSFFKDNQTYYNCRTLDNGWLHITEIPESYIQNNTQILIQTLLFTVIISLMLTILIVILFSRKLTSRIASLSYAMESFHLGHDPENLSIITMPHPDDVSSYDEIDRLGITFEDMQHTIAKNLKSIVSLSINEERLKYQLLQSQINPHFLYNILGTIRTCQALGKLDIADQMLTNLTAFYRLTLRKSKELIPIKDELEIARLYLEMEKLCHKDNLDWEINAEDGIENFMICKFTLQPFLENSILHGLSTATPEVFISIHVLYGDDTVVIAIEDNGAGMPPETLDQLRYTIDHKIINYEKHFGISNVSARISNPLYGNGSVRIDSHPGNGTYVTIEFQQMEDTYEENNDRR